jgi:hypothetical protein
VVRKGLPRFPRVTVAFGPPLELPGADLPRSERARVVTERLVQAFQNLLDSSPEAR